MLNDIAQLFEMSRPQPGGSPMRLHLLLSGTIALWIINGAYGIAHSLRPEIGDYAAAHRVALTLAAVATLAWFIEWRKPVDEYESGYTQGRIDQMRKDREDRE